MCNINPAKMRVALLDLRREMIKHIEKHNMPFNPTDLAGACGLCSALVFRFLKRRGYKPVFRMNHWHCFVTVNTYYADLTLKQFNRNAPNVYFEAIPYNHDHGMGNVHKTNRSAKTAKQIRRIFRGWPSEQNPFRQKLPKVTVAK